MPPETIAGRYQVERAIGRGGMGTVWLCRDEVLGREVAVKQVGIFPGESAPDLARALREARSSAALNHPHVVSVFDAVEADDHIWLVMEYVPGATLAELITREGRLDPARVASIGAQVADALAVAHTRGTIHRDVKPDNILVDGDVAKISDFGIARTAGDTQLTRSGLVTGTPLYFSPQLARGGDPTPGDDVWALGATLYAALEGTPPAEDRGNAIATLAAIAESRPRRPEHGGFLTDAVGRMLDPDPQSRWSMADAAHTLRRLHDQHRPVSTLESTRPRDERGTTAVERPVAAPPVPPAPVERRGRSRWPVVVGLLVLLLVGGIAAAVALQPDDDPSAGPFGGPTTRESGSSPTGTTPSTATATATVTETASPGTGTTDGTEGGQPGPPAGADSPEEAVVDYYSLLPDDTQDAWAMLGPAARDSARGYDNYVGFWNTVGSVQVDGTSVDGDIVTVDLTYDGDESETRQLQVARGEGGWIIADDLGS